MPDTPIDPDRAIAEARLAACVRLAGALCCSCGENDGRTVRISGYRIAGVDVFRSLFSSPNLPVNVRRHGDGGLWRRVFVPSAPAKARHAEVWVGWPDIFGDPADAEMVACIEQRLAEGVHPSDHDGDCPANIGEVSGWPSAVCKTAVDPFFVGIQSVDPAAEARPACAKCGADPSLVGWGEQTGHCAECSPPHGFLSLRLHAPPRVPPPPRGWDARYSVFGVLLSAVLALGGCGTPMDDSIPQAATKRIVATDHYGTLYAVTDTETGATVYWATGYGKTGVAVLPKKSP